MSAEVDMAATGGIRISGGSLRGRMVEGVIHPDVRPTTGRVREALFSLVGQDLNGSRILDAFGGTGLVGLEAWSRGADVVVVELRERVAQSIRHRGEALSVGWDVLTGDVLGMADTLGTFSGVFADPPYRCDPLPILESLAPLSEDWFIMETGNSSQVPPQEVSGLILDRVRNYGATTLWVYRNRV